MRGFARNQLIRTAILGACIVSAFPLTLGAQMGNLTDPFERSRQRMVDEQIEHPYDSRPAVKDDRVLRAMRSVPRHYFVDEEHQDQAYADRPLPIGLGQTISQPYIVAYMTEMLAIDPSHVVLEIGTGSGYQAAVLAHLARRVFSIEIVAPLAARAKRTLAALGYDNVSVKAGDGYLGWPGQAPFDEIIVTAAPDHIPQPLIDQLKPGGRLVIPVGPMWSTQRLTLLTKNQEGGIEQEVEMPVGFVPLTRE